MNKDKTVSLILIVTLIVACTSLGTSAYASISLSYDTVFEEGSGIETASYIISRDGSTYYVKNGDTGEIAYSGTNAKTIINNVIDAIPSEGGRIFFKVGTYLIRDTVYYTDDLFIIDKNNLRISGEGWGSIIRLDDNVCSGTDGCSFFRVTASNVTFDNFCIDANYQNQGTIDPSKDGYNIHMATTAKDFSMYNMYSKFATGDGVELSGIRASVVNCKFEECWEHDIHFNGVRDAVATGNLLLNEINNGMISTYASNGDTEHISISGNVIRGGNEDGIKIGGGPNDTRYVNVDGNVLIGQGRHGIWAYKGDVGTSEYISITNNIVKGANAHGIYIQEGEHYTIDANMIAFCGGDGVRLEPHAPENLSDIRIRHNDITQNNRNDTSYSGISLICGDQDIRRLRIEQNDIHCTGGVIYDYGIEIPTAGTGGFPGSDIRFNYIPDSGNDNGAWELTHLNDGLGTENVGINVTAAGTVTFSHGLLGTPDYVELGWLDTGWDDWDWSATSTEITITTTTNGAFDFNWYARYDS